LTNSPRYPMGSWSRVVHALCGVVAATALMAFNFAVLGPMLKSRTLLTVRPKHLSSSRWHALWAVILVVYLLLIRGGRLDLSELGLARFRPQDVLWGIAGFAAIAVLVVSVVGPRDALTTIAGFTLPQRLLFVVIGLTVSALGGADIPWVPSTSARRPYRLRSRSAGRRDPLRPLPLELSPRTACGQV